jgi:uncharacterized protein YjbI with pentapeptide repeats
MSGDSQSLQVQGDINAELSGLLKKLADLGIAGSAKLNTEQYAGVSRSDLPSSLKDQRECKLKVFDALQKKLLSENTTVPRREDPSDGLSRLSKGLELLGHDDPTGRRGGVYMLRDLMNTSEPYHQQTLELLCDFVRSQTTTRPVKETGPAGEIQEALTAIGHRKSGPGQVDLTDAKIPGAVLDGADLSGANLKGADLRGARLEMAHLTNSDLSSANLNGADLKGASLSKARLTSAQLFNAKLGKANLSDATLSLADFRGADVSDANLSGAFILGAHLDGANLSGAFLSDAIISGQLVQTSLRGTDLSGAFLDHARLNDVDLTTATVTSGTSFYQACGEGSHLPPPLHLEPCSPSRTWAPICGETTPIISSRQNILDAMKDDRILADLQRAAGCDRFLGPRPTEARMKDSRYHLFYRLQNTPH